VQNAKRLGAAWDALQAPARAKASANLMDRWIQAERRDLVLYVREEMALYHLYNVMPRLVRFVDQLTNWYVRLNRNRLKGADAQLDCESALSVLFETLLVMCSLMAPFTPFFTEHVFQTLLPPGSPRRAVDSVHFTAIPLAEPLSADDLAVMRKVRTMQRAVQLGRNARGDVSIKKPVLKVVVVTDDAAARADLVELREYVQEELNAFELEAASEPGAWGRLSVSCVAATLGKRLKGDFARVRKLVEAFPDPHRMLRELEEKGRFEVQDAGAACEILPGDVAINREFLGDAAQFGVASNPDLMICVDKTVTQLLVEAGLAREFKSIVQKLRKSSGLIPEDRVGVYCQFLDSGAPPAERDDLVSTLRRVLFAAARDDGSVDPRVKEALALVVRPMQDLPAFAVRAGSCEDAVGGVKLRVVLTRPCVLAAGVAVGAEIEHLLNAIGPERLPGKELNVVLNGVLTNVRGWQVV
jgi:isoleucyl-tRNA synthetase